MNTLSHYFTGAAAKYLSSVEVNKLASNQHEFHGISVFKNIFGLQRKSYTAQFIYINNENQTSRDSGGLTWYDARENDFSRSSEYRLYYTGSRVMNKAKKDDLMLVCLRNDGTVTIVIISPASTTFKIMKLIFGVEHFNVEYSRININRQQVEQQQVDLFEGIFGN